MASNTPRKRETSGSDRKEVADLSDNGVFTEALYKSSDSSVKTTTSLEPEKSCPWTQLVHWDEQVTARLGVCSSSDSSKGQWRPVMKLLEYSCHGLPWFIGNTVAILITHQIQLQQKLVNLFVALLLDLVVVAIVKAVFRRRRPAHNKMDMFGTVSVDKFSFPSGHCTRAAMVAYFLLDNFSLGPLLGGLILCWALCVSLSRVLLGRHHVLDVLCGFLIGLAVYRFLVTWVWLSAESCRSLLQPLHEDLHL